MNRNNVLEISEITNIIATTESKENITSFMEELFTKSELETLSKRWRILRMLNQGKTQREIAQELKVSLCKVTRGAKILKNKNSIIAKYFKKEKIYGDK
jgi:TrpR family trp operon transcriptional repressor